MKLPALLRGRQHVVLDTMVLIYLFEDHPRMAGAAEFVLQEVERGVFSAAITPITAAEVLVKPLAARQTELADRYRGALQALPNVELVSLDVECGWMAAALRAKYQMPLPDMMQVAIALRSERPAIITNDHAMKRIAELPVVLLDDIIGQ